MRIFFLLALFTLVVTPLARAASIDTSFRFSTIETPHFAIHYHQGLEEMAQKSAAMAEEIHTRLVAIIPWEPREKTQLVLIDDSDFANGLTTVLPYDVIILQPVPPAALSTIGEYDDWLRTIITHEYTHVLTSDPARGYSKVTRQIFGKPVPAADVFSLLALIATGPPNVFMPRWWHEGMATWGETELTGKGRGRSSFFEMVYRSAVAEERLPSLDKLNGEVPYWPNGDLPYLFGTRLMTYIADSYGSEALGQLTIAHSGRFPYFINAPPEELFNERSYPVLYREMLEEMKLEQREKIALLKKAPLTPVTLLGKPGDGETSPRFSPDGRLLAFNRADRHGHPAVVIAEKDGKTVKARFRRLLSDEALSWAPDGKRLFFSQAEIHRGFDVYQDLYAYDLERDRVTRLTRGLRAGEPAISPDGNRFAVVLTNRGSQNLALLDARAIERGEKAPPRLITDYRLYRVSSPGWSPDGRSIAYTMTDNTGRSSLRLYEVDKGSDRELFGARFTIASPAWTKDGQYLLYSADETGVFNLFAFSLAENVSRQVTHLLGGAFQPDIAPDGSTIVFSSYGAKGVTLAAVADDRSRWTTERSPSIAAGWREREKLPPFAQTTPQEAITPATPYSPWPTLAPRFWLPALAGEGKDGTAAGALTAGQDVLGYHSYLAEFLYGTKYKKPYYDLVYRNDLFYPSLQLRTYAQPVLYTNLLQRGDYVEINRGLIAQLSVPLNNLESRLRFTLGYQLQDQKALSPLRNGLFSGVAVFQGRRDNAFATLAFSDSLKYPWSVSHEEGRNLSVTAKYYGPETGSDLSSREYLADYEEFFRLPGGLTSHHVLVARLSGGLADGDLTPQQAFQLGGLRSFLNPFALRGYPERSETGKYVATGTLEHRFPAWYILRGFGSKPIFLDRLHGATFVDAGQVWDDNRSFRSDRIKVGAGLEARLDMTIGYWARLTPAIGYAHGFNQGGEDRLYFTIYVDL